MSDVQMNGVVSNAQILNIDENVVATLEMLLDLARRGRLWGVTCVTAENGGAPGKYAAINERVGPATLAAMAGFSLMWANVCNAEADRKMNMVRPTGVLKPNGQQAMAPVNREG